VIAWVYRQRTGQLYGNGELAEVGYSGRDEGLNNGARQFEPNVGPIPRGVWKIVGRATNVTPLGWRLAYVNGMGTRGRSGFQVHGGKLDGTRTASHGCVVLSRHTRTRMSVGELIHVVR
jgi:hypothetical protein